MGTTYPMNVYMYIKRKEILKLYNETQNRHVCYDCGMNFILSSNLKTHVRYSACIGKKKTTVKRPCDIVRENKDLKNYKPNVGNKKRKELRRKASLAPLLLHNHIDTSSFEPIIATTTPPLKDTTTTTKTTIEKEQDHNKSTSKKQQQQHPKI